MELMDRTIGLIHICPLVSNTEELSEWWLNQIKTKELRVTAFTSKSVLVRKCRTEHIPVFLLQLLQGLTLAT